jgi:hypothetical protein
MRPLLSRPGAALPRTRVGLKLAAVGAGFGAKVQRKEPGSVATTKLFVTGFDQFVFDRTAPSVDTARGHREGYLKNGGTLEKAAQMANHASTRTTQLYHRRREELSLDEVERIRV